MNKIVIHVVRASRAPLALLAGLLLPAVAFAHPGHLSADVPPSTFLLGTFLSSNVFAQGFVHPFTGLDHLLAMLASGMWAVQLGGRARWQVPMVFVGMMMLGALLGMSTGAVAQVETGVIASVIVLGLLVAATVRAPRASGAVVVAAFAALHGHTHGAEMPSVAGAGFYIAGFALATALLHSVAVIVATLLQSSRRAVLVRIIGALIAAAGTVLLAF